MTASHLFSPTINLQEAGTPARVGVPILGAIFALAAVFSGMALLGTDAAWAMDAGTLKLMVTDCSGAPYDGASVSVEIRRAGSGIVATDDGYTEKGYVEFSFTILEGGDQARVSVEACGTDDATHVYTWISPNGNAPSLWDIESCPNSTCGDTWWDEQENIIQLRCD